MEKQTQAVVTPEQALKRFVALQAELRELEAKVKAVKEELANLEPAVLTYFENMGIQRLTVDGYTVYVRRQLWASKRPEVSWEEACDAMLVYGLDEYVGPRFNAQQVSAWVREREQDGLPPVPPELEHVLTVTEKYTVQCQKAR